MTTTAATSADIASFAEQQRMIDRVGTGALQAPGALSASASAVSWGAIFAGAAAAAALSLILMILGTGLGLASVSPWAQAGLGASAVGVSAILWLTLTQLLASGMGGYLAGRLRSKWSAVHSDEAYFRDTAHGFLAWAIASLATAALLGSVITSIIGGGVQAGAALAGNAVSAVSTGAAAVAAGSDTPGANGATTSYFVDALLRKDMAAAAPRAAASGASADAPTSTPVPNADNGEGRPAAAPNAAANATPNAAPVMADAAPAAASGEVARILMNSLRTGALPADDARYVAQVVAQRTGLSQQDADKRVADTYARMQTKLREAELATRDTADKARKASASAALWLFVSLLVGAFVASFAATLGGRQRDN